MNRKQILRELLPLLLPVSSGVHSIIIDYLDIQAAIRANYLTVLREAFKRIPQEEALCYPFGLHPSVSCEHNKWQKAFDRPEAFNDAFVIFDEEPGFIDRAIWVFYDGSCDPEEAVFWHPGAISTNAFHKAVAMIFPDMQNSNDRFEGLSRTKPLSRRAANCQSLQVYYHYAKILSSDFSRIPYKCLDEWMVYQKEGTKPALIKPPLTRLGRLRARYNKWAEQRNDIHQQETQFVVFWTTFLSLLVFHVVLFSPVDPWSQRVGAIGTLCCWMLLTSILLYETAKEWRWAGKCARLMWVTSCIVMISYAIKITLILRDLEANPHVILEFNWILQLKSLFN